MKMYKILIVEDDIIINGGIKVYLEKQGYQVDSVDCISDANEALSKEYHLIILDINLPDGSGLDFCAQIRKSRKTPIIFLTAKDTEEDMILGFEQGCDDYIAKPFSVQLLGQRVKAVLRRSAMILDDHEIFQYKELDIDFEKRKVQAAGNPIKLSPTEFKLLQILVENRGQVVTRDILFEKVWDCDENYIDENTLSVHIRRLRNKLESDPKNPEYIITVFGIGYTFGE